LQFADRFENGEFYKEKYKYKEKSDNDRVIQELTFNKFYTRRGWRDEWEGREVQVVITFQKVTE